MEDDDKKMLSELKNAPVKKVVYFEVTELSYSKALQLIAEWWEAIRADGINVAAEVQSRRAALKGKPAGPTGPTGPV